MARLLPQITRSCEACQKIVLMSKTGVSEKINISQFLLSKIITKTEKKKKDYESKVSLHSTSSNY